MADIIDVIVPESADVGELDAVIDAVVVELSVTLGELEEDGVADNDIV